ncbi:MAG: trigger factor [Mariprofundaceae bacterium]|nr:trigger factor [Mariprofundaceae bacterium]
MIKTEVNHLSDNEHRIDVHVAQCEYTRLYEDNLKKLMGQNIRLPGFRPGKVPRHVIVKKFAGNLHQDTVSALVQEHYGSALDKSGLQPAVQPVIDLPEAQPDDGFSFNLVVTTWPNIELSPLADLAVEKWDVTVDDADVDGVIERLIESQFRYEAADKSVEADDKVCMDYIGYIGDEAFDGGTAENAELVIGSGAYIPGFEEQLMNAEAGQHVQVALEFPVNYQAEALAGQSARFEVDIKTVMKGTSCASVDDLAELLGFADEAALREDARTSLAREAAKATLEKTRESVDASLLAANSVDVPERIVREHVQHGVKRYEERRQQEGGAPLSDEEQARFMSYGYAVENEKLQASVIMQAIREQAELTVSDEDVDAELGNMAAQYPENQREAYVQWMKSSKENRDGIESSVLERKCVDYVLSQAHVTVVVKTITQLQEEIDAAQVVDEATTAET